VSNLLTCTSTRAPMTKLLTVLTTHSYEQYCTCTVQISKGMNFFETRRSSFFFQIRISLFYVRHTHNTHPHAKTKAKREHERHQATVSIILISTEYVNGILADNQNLQISTSTLDTRLLQRRDIAQFRIHRPNHTEGVG
jgi:hypothetical protein